MAKSRTNKFIDTIDECLTNGVNSGIFQVSLENDTFNGRHVTIGGRSVVNFGSCSYLGLEVDERLKQGAIDAAIKYGVQYSSSRLFSSCNLYEEFEGQLNQIFGHPSIMSPTTTLTHVGAIPILIQDEDLVILDHQVHGSVQLAVQLVKARGTKVEMIRHSNMQMLEDLVKENPNKYNKIWYMADGLYSMYGDFAPLKEITALLEKYGNFHVYIDDAHGMSWAGKHGRGYVLSQMDLHPKMVLTTSLSKGFGAAGGATVIYDKELRRKILTCGSSYTFSGPEHPPMLGAGIASAKIHLSDEIYSIQDNLQYRINLTRTLIDQYKLPHVLPSDSPIFYLALGLPRVGYNMVKRLLNEGYYTNIGIFPGVPVKCCGLRLAVTNGQTLDDIKGVLDAYHHHFPKVLEEEGQTVEDLSNNFSMDFPEAKTKYSAAISVAKEKAFDVQHETTIQKIDNVLWDALLGDNGTFDWEGCRFIEETFRDNPEPENNWDLHYVIIRDKETAKPILATFFSVLLCKDDMIAPASVSRKVEMERKIDKYFRTSKVVMMGSLISIGNHLYVDRSNSNWQSALSTVLSIMDNVKTSCHAQVIQLRDFNSDDTELKDFFAKEGLIRVELFNDHTIGELRWNSTQEYLLSLSRKSRAHLRKYILPNEKLFHVSIKKGFDPESLDEKISLYKQVKDRGFEFNTFYLPDKFFKNLASFEAWEIIELSLLKSEYPDKVVGFGICYRSNTGNYIPMVIGIDYELNLEYGVYRQMLFQAVRRGQALGAKKVLFGYGADIEKSKFGTQMIKKSAYVQADDNFSMESLSNYQQVNYEKT